MWAWHGVVVGGWLCGDDGGGVVKEHGEGIQIL